MPTIKEKIKFNYDGRWSSDFGVIHVTTNNSLFEDILASSRELTETKRTGRSESILQRVDYAQIEIPMAIAFEAKFTDQKVRDVVDWLFKESYKPLYFEGAEDRIFFCTPTADASLLHNGLKNGYIEFTMRCNSGFAYSPLTSTALIDNTAGGKKTFSVTHDGYGTLYPEISITKSGAGYVEVRNVTTAKPLMRISNLASGEGIYINTEKEQIESDIVGVYHYDDIIGSYLTLAKGSNTIEVNGACTIQLRYRMKYLF
ncbi:MAG: phage distal tail protein [Gammaproteobacteria bacterium]